MEVHNLGPTRPNAVYHPWIVACQGSGNPHPAIFAMTGYIFKKQALGELPCPTGWPWSAWWVTHCESLPEECDGALTCGHNSESHLPSRCSDQSRLLSPDGSCLLHPAASCPHSTSPVFASYVCKIHENVHECKRSSILLVAYRVRVCAHLHACMYYVKILGLKDNKALSLTWLQHQMMAFRVHEPSQVQYHRQNIPVISPHIEHHTRTGQSTRLAWWKTNWELKWCTSCMKKQPEACGHHGVWHLHENWMSGSYTAIHVSVSV